MSILIFLHIFSAIVYVYLIARVYFPNLVYLKPFGRLTVNFPAEHLPQDYTSMNKAEIKKHVFRKIGKSEFKILLDDVMTVAKDLIKFSPILISIATRDQVIYLSYAQALFVYFLTTKALKKIVHKKRPDGLNSKSFPSGHTASAFVGATFFTIKYGWKIGLPIYAVATMVGWSRVYCERHTVLDVLGGAFFGIIAGLVPLATTGFIKNLL